MIGQGFKNLISDAMKPNFDGFIDGYFEGDLQGWMRKKGTDTPVAIDIIVDGKRTNADVVCNEMRDDLRAAGVGDGTHGFRVPFDLNDYDGAAEVVIRLADSKIQLLTKTIDVVKLKAQLAALNLTLDDRGKPVVIAPLVSPYEGHIEWSKQTEIRGWMVNKDSLDDVFDADLYVNGTWYCQVRNDARRDDLEQRKMSNGRGGFDVSIPNGLLNEGTNTLCLKLPDGEVSTQDIQAALTPFHIPAAQPQINTAVSIIVPVYDAFEDVTICVEHLLEHTTQEARLVLIDDASLDPRIAPLLKRYAGHTNIKVLTNKTNKGFTASINRGITEAGEDDVVFLNSDARVTPGWLEGLRIAAASDPGIATVTAMSDRAGAFSAPRIGNDNTLPFGVSEAEYATAVRRNSLRLYPTVPTGNGFCMYVRRAAIAAVGHLDAAVFPRGYGEENDFCMRARAAGWRNIIDDSTYVFHAGSKSFGDQKTDLIAAGLKVVNARYPDYSAAIKVFTDSPKISLARYKVHEAENQLRAANPVLPRALFVIATPLGGTPQTNRDLMIALGSDWDCWLMRCDATTLTLSRMKQGKLVVMAEHRLLEPVSPTTHTSFEYDRVVAVWLAAYHFELVHIRQLIWHSLSLPKLAKQAGAIVVNSFHDFYSLSPAVKLLDNDNVFCGAKLPKDGEYAGTDLWPAGSMPPLTQDWIDIWQRKFVDALAPCDAFVTTSPSARDMIMSVMPDKTVDRFAVIPHGRDFAAMHGSLNWPRPDEAIRILVPGNIDLPKGRAVIEALLDLDETEQRLEFHILGDHDFEGAGRGLHFHGRYERGTFATRVAKIAPHVGAVLSIWDETYCHTLTEMWAAGLPVVGLDYPTVATRIRNSGAGWVYSEQDMAAFYKSLTRDLDDIDGFLATHKALIAWQHGEGRSNNTRAMASKYQALYQTARAHAKRTAVPFQAPDVAPLAFEAFVQNRIAVVCPASPDLQTGPASTYVRIWARTFNTPERDLSYIRMSATELVAAARTGEIDKAIIQRTAIPARVWKVLQGLVKAGKLRYVLDLDDDLMNVPADKDPDSAYAAYAPVLRDIIASAKHVTVSTQVLGTHVAKINKDYSVVPNLLSGRIWRGDLPSRMKEGIVRGLYMGNRSHDADFELVRPAFEAVARSHPQLRLRLVGALHERPAHIPPWLEIVDIPHNVQEYPAFVQWLRSQIDQIDFGVSPLAETAFNTQKSNLKILDYAGLGLPVLASKHSVYEPLRGADHVQLVTNTQSAWEKALQTQVEGEPLDAARRNAARAWITQDHLLEDTLAGFDALLRDKLFKADT